MMTSTRIMIDGQVDKEVQFLFSSLHCRYFMERELPVQQLKYLGWMPDISKKLSNITAGREPFSAPY